MDWGCYDLTTLIELLRPMRVDIAAAWVGNPGTALGLPPGTVFDVEEQAGASLVFHRVGGQRVVAYERSMASNAQPASWIEIEGDTAAVSWDGVDWEDEDRVTVTRDEPGTPAEYTEPAGKPVVGVHQRPLVSFVQHLRGAPSDSLAGDDALFNFRCPRAIYDVAGTGTPQTVAL